MIAMMLRDLPVVSPLPHLRRVPSMMNDRLDTLAVFRRAFHGRPAIVEVIAHPVSSEHFRRDESRADMAASVS
jgi:hypothetical protein